MSKTTVVPEEGVVHSNFDSDLEPYMAQMQRANEEMARDQQEILRLKQEIHVLKSQTRALLSRLESAEKC